MSRLSTILAQGARDFSNAVFGLCRFSWSSRRTSPARKKKKKKEEEEELLVPRFSEFTVHEGISAKGELNYEL